MIQIDPKLYGRKVRGKEGVLGTIHGASTYEEHTYFLVLKEDGTFVEPVLQDCKLVPLEEPSLPKPGTFKREDA